LSATTHRQAIDYWRASNAFLLTVDEDGLVLLTVL